MDGNDQRQRLYRSPEEQGVHWHAPRWDERLEERHRATTQDRGRKHGVAERRRSAPKQKGRGQAAQDDDRDLDHRAPSFLALATRSAIRFRSSSESRAASPPRRATTACSGEPSKKVSTRCRSADLRAAWRGTAGRYTYRSPCSS